MPKINHYPDWPRRMTTKQAEAYTNAYAETLKASGVRFARMNGRDFWDRADLDAWIDGQFGRAKIQGDANDILKLMDGNAA